MPLTWPSSPHFSTHMAFHASDIPRGSSHIAHHALVHNMIDHVRHGEAFQRHGRPCERHGGDVKGMVRDVSMVDHARGMLL